MLNNPIKHTDPSGHCVFIPPFDTAVYIALLALVLTGDTPVDKTVHDNWPENLTFVNAANPCEGTLAQCFQAGWAKDFAEYDDDNPISTEEFNEFADAVAEDLYTHDLTSPGIQSGRGAYDTPFYSCSEVFLIFACCGRHPNHATNRHQRTRK